MSELWYSNLISPDAQAHAEKVAEKIGDEIKNKGPMPFARFMEMALYAPGLGYYCVGTEKIGRQGDFVTAPEISPLFAQCLAQYCEKKHAALGSYCILEIGAGSGRLALGILRALAEQAALPDKYFILDLSPELQQRQKALFQTEAPEFLDRLQWLNEWPSKPLDGVIIANEVLDAMPVSLFEQTEQGLKERCVILDQNEQFQWALQNPSEELSKAVAELDIQFPASYYSEINLNISPWIRSLSQVLGQGEAILIDYGFLREEYYHPQRAAGTLMCHFQQHAHTDPLVLTGVQDITVHVDFTAVGQAAESSGMKVDYYGTQAQFLLNQGLLDLMQKNATTPEQQFSLANQVKMLTLPSEMGELFKVMVLSAALPSL